jgi:hypothetical protein
MVKKIIQESADSRSTRVDNLILSVDTSKIWSSKSLTLQTTCGNGYLNLSKAKVRLLIKYLTKLLEYMK